MCNVAAKYMVKKKHLAPVRYSAFSVFNNNSLMASS